MRATRANVWGLALSATGFVVRFVVALVVRFVVAFVVPLVMRFVVALVVPLVVEPALAAATPLGRQPAAPPPRTCLPDEKLDPRRGRCALVDTLKVLLPRNPAAPPMVVSNFGVLLASPTGGGAYVCEESMGLPALDLIRLDAADRVLAPGPNGMQTSSGIDRCGWTRTPAPVDGRFVADVAPDPTDARRLWVLLGSAARELYRSDDAGVSFSQVISFAPEQRMFRLAVAPSDPRVLYVAGYTRDAGLVLVVTRDGGATFETISPAVGFADSRWVTFLGASPHDPQTVFMARAATSNGGDEIWRSSDGGRTGQKILELPVGHTEAGFAFGEAPGVVYVAGRPVLQREDGVTAELYVSRDDGVTWAPPALSGPAGPRYRCVGSRAGRLYACGGGVDVQDSFLLGVSDDEGRTWQPVVTTDSLTGPVACSDGACALVDAWLCESYGICGGPDAGAPSPGLTHDASADASLAAPASDGCACAVGAPSRGALSNVGVGMPMILFAMLVRRLKRRGRLR